MKSVLLKNIGQVISPGKNEFPLRGTDQSKLTVENDLSILVKNGRIYLDGAGEYTADTVIDCRGKVVTPGFLDSHTHIVYAGSRYEEFYQKISGASYLQILESGNGIMRTIRETEAAPVERIYQETMERVRNAISHGTTTMEMKTGYAKSPAGEGRMLDVMDMISSTGEIDVVKTLLPLHAKSYAADEKEHLDIVLSKVIPDLLGRADFVDAFCDAGAFTPASTEAFFASVGDKGKRLHSDEIQDIGCLSLAEKFSLSSADHLLKTENSGVEKLSVSGTTANILPVTAFALGERYSDARRFINSGVPVTISTDSSPLTRNQDIVFAIYLAIRFCGIKVEEAFNAITANAAHSLGLQGSKGSITDGKDADLVVFDVEDYREIPYEYSSGVVSMVMSRGNISFQSGRNNDSARL